MRYIELVANDGTVISVATVENPNFLRYSKRHDIFLGCTEKEAEAISVDNTICYLEGNEHLTGVRDNIILNAIFIDKDEYDRLEFLSSYEPLEEKQSDDSIVSESSPTEKIMSQAEMRVAIAALQSDVEALKQTPAVAPVNDEATIRFYETLSDSSTNSIAKIRAAAQQYLEDTSLTAESEVE